MPKSPSPENAQGLGSERPFRTMGRLVSLRQAVVHQVAPDTTLVDAARLMQEHGIDAVMVIDGDRPAGVLSLGDIAGMAVRQPHMAPRDLRAADAMAAAMAAATAHADLSTTVPQALALLDERRRDYLPVVADGRVVDLISRTDLLKELVWHHTETIREMKLQERIMHLQGVYSC